MLLRDFLKIAFRWLLAIGLIGGAFAVGLAAFGKSQPPLSLAAGVPLLFAMLMVAGGVVLISPELVEWFTAPMRALFSHLFFPGTAPDPAPPDYTLPRFYRKEERYAEALEWYRRLLRAHPQELEAVLEAMETAFESGNPLLARKIRKAGVRKLRDRAAQQEVWKRYATLLAEHEEARAVAEDQTP